MFEEKKIGDPGWSPFSVKQKPVQSDRRIDPDKAREVSPIIMRTNFDFSSSNAVKDEAEADVDPKALSVICSAGVSEIGSSTSSSPQIQTTELIHPSSLQPSQDNPASVEKESKKTETTLSSPVLTPLMNLGPSAQSAEVQP